jgi:hypothetical protein
VHAECHVSHHQPPALPPWPSWLERMLSSRDTGAAWTADGGATHTLGTTTHLGKTQTQNTVCWPCWRSALTMSNVPKRGVFIM